MLPQTQAQQRLLAQALRAAQPRPDVFAQAIASDPSVQYSTVLPLGVQTTPDPAGSMLANQRTVMAMPELVRGLLEGIAAPNQVRQGKMDPMTGAMLTAGAAPAGALLARAPAGALGMNVLRTQKELPMDEASRMARAREMGFDTKRVVYHGTSSDGFNAFDDAKIGSANDAGFYGRGHYFATTPGEARYFGPNVESYLTRGRYLDLSNETGDYTARGHFKSFAPKLDKIGALDDAQKAALADIKKAEKYVADNVEYSVGVGADGTEGVYAQVKTPAPDFTYDITIRPDYRGNFPKTKEEALQRLQDTFMGEMESHHPEIYPNISMDNWSVSLSDYVRADSNIGAQGLTEAAKRAGYDGIIYGDETVVFDPKNMRRAAAAFDPAKSDSANLLSANPASAALPGLLMGGPSMTQQQMRDLLADPSGA